MNDYDDARNLFCQMIQRRPLPSVIEFNKLLGVVMKKKHYSTAICLAKRMLLSGLLVDEITLNIVINCYSHLNSTYCSYSILGVFYELGFVPKVTTFTTLLNGLVRENSIPEANAMFKKVVRNRLCEPNHVMYGTINYGICKSGFTEKALALPRLIKQGKCKPGVIEYSNVIDSLCKGGMLDDAFDLFHEMIDMEIRPHVVTYTSLMHGLCYFSRWKEVKDLLNEMELHKIPLDLCTYAILVGGLCKEGKAKDAEEALETMIEKGEMPDVVVYCH